MRKSLCGVVLITTSIVASTALPARGASQFGSTACSGVRPGAIIQAPRGTIYTMGFLFRGTDAKKKTANYVATVGNFVLPTFGTKVYPPKSGPQAYDALGKPIGRFVYALHSETPAFQSFGLVQLDKNIKPNAQVCHFGGPTGVYTGMDVVPQTVSYFGNGFPIDALATARTALTTGAADEDTVWAQGLFSPIDTGDTGAPFLVGGEALGYWDGGIGGGTGGAGFAIARLGPRLTQVQKALKLKLVLQTAKTL
ncbi:MAG TPA: hypothetical protein VFA34_04390 [Actinomycetota bacterium]|jgi:hypothetical protein|nr:hypothetical protein [Actinomycetota bacterium]